MGEEFTPKPESLVAQYNRELLEAKTEALKVLADLLRTSQDPAEARRIARVILSVKPIAPPKAAPTEPAPSPPALSPHALGTLHLSAAAKPIADPGRLPVQAAAPSALPVALTATGEPPQGGGPAGARPLPLPLGPPRA